jgi:hypothetical protein
VLPIKGKAEPCMERGKRSQPGTDGRRAMVALLQGNELVLLRCSLCMILIPDEADRAVHCIGAAKSKVNMIEVTGSSLRQFCRQPDSGF